MPTEIRNKMTVSIASVEAGKFVPNALLLKPAPFPLGLSGVPLESGPEQGRTETILPRWLYGSEGPVGRGHASNM